MVENDKSGGNKESNDHRSLSGLNFRDLVHTMDRDKDSQQGVNQSNLYFNDDFTEATPTDNNFAGGEKSTNFFKRRYDTISSKLSYIINKFFLFRFIRDFSSYLATRLRVVLVLMSVVAEVIGSQIEVLKKLVIKRMFWGRGSLFNFSVKFFAVFLVLLILLSVVYRGRTIESSYQIASEAGNPDASEYHAGVLIQGSSAQTTRNEEAVSTELREYTVKGGDTISTISEFTGVNVNAILFQNDMNEGDIIKPGMVLKIPPGNGLIVEVKSGDTIESLASEYKVNAQNILDINKNVLEPPDFKLVAGVELFLPEGVAPEAPEPEPVPAPIAKKPIYSGIVSSGGSASTGTQAPATGGGRWLGWPVAGAGRLTQCYSGWHNGIDIADKSFPTIVAAAPGKVVFSGCQSGSCPTLGGYTGGGWGLAWSVIIDHGNGFSTIYGHLNNLYVSTGQSVSQGQSIGQMGQTGLAYGVHLHFMTVYSGTWSSVNPAQFMTTSICGY